MIEVIAEVGVNHNGSFDQALRLIDTAKSAECDTVKFQLFHGDRYPHLQLNAEQLATLRDYAIKRDLKFLCTPDDIDDARAIKDMGCDRIKIGSSNITNIPLLHFVGTLDMDVILSSGACTLDELDDALRARSCPLGAIIRNCTVMHCVSAYPSPARELNLGVLETLRDRDYIFEVGYSDHTVGSNYQSALVALGLGARVFEKHLTAGHWMRGPDHKMSADIFEMKRYVIELREAAAALGDGKKRIMDCETDNRKDYEKFVKAQHRGTV